jgi:PAS domain S-box-containing protein
MYNSVFQNKDELLQFALFSIDHAADAIFWVKQDAGFFYANHAASRLFGYTREELLSMKVYDLEASDKGEASWPKFWELIREKRSMILESKVRRKDGSIFIMEIHTNFFDYKGSEFKVTYARDISERKRTNAELQLKNDELQKLNAELDRFVYRVSHDLRAPLTSILGLVNVARMNNSGEKQEVYLDMIARTAGKLDELVLSITEYARNARLETQYTPVDLKKEVNDCIENLKFLQGADRISFRINIQEQIPYCGDCTRIRIILNNLVSNAIKYSNPLQAGPFVSIAIDVNAERMQIVISDNGQGISEEHHARLFSMFYRASESSFGSGIGLYIVKETVDKLCGTISFQSKKEEGSVFTVILPNTDPRVQA